MNWVVVLILSMIPFFSFYWIYNEFSFVKRIDPKNKSLMLFGAVFVMLFAYFVLIALGLMLGDTMMAILGSAGFLCMLASWAMAILAIFQARASLVQYYNTTENIGLKLSPVMTFFFSIYYFQYHFQRIHEWRTTGTLRPQG
jgi:hypothetical protein